MSTSVVTHDVLVSAKLLRDYLNYEMEVEKADCILIFGSLDLVAADRGAELFHAGYASRIICSGGSSSRKHLLGERLSVSEAENLSKRLMDLGVPEDAVVLETLSSNTMENISFSYELMVKLGIQMDMIIVIQKPYMLRRTYATLLKNRPIQGTKFRTTSVSCSFEEYVTIYDEPERLINRMVGDMQRIRVYAEGYKRDSDPLLPDNERIKLKKANGYLVYQDIPDEVRNAFEHLVDLGYNKQLIQVTA